MRDFVSGHQRFRGEEHRVKAGGDDGGVRMADRADAEVSFFAMHHPSSPSFLLHICVPSLYRNQTIKPGHARSNMPIATSLAMANDNDSCTALTRDKLPTTEHDRMFQNVF